MLTAEQRYRQARQKAHIISRRNLEAMLRGDRFDSGPCTMDLERRFIVAEIERLRAGLERMLKHPPADLDEPDEDWRVIVKMREIARKALGHSPAGSREDEIRQSKNSENVTD